MSNAANSPVCRSILFLSCFSVRSETSEYRKIYLSNNFILYIGTRTNNPGLLSNVFLLMPKRYGKYKVAISMFCMKNNMKYNRIEFFDFLKSQPQFLRKIASLESKIVNVCLNFLRFKFSFVKIFFCSPILH